MSVTVAGFNKLSLIDYPKKMATTVFLSGCNFNCGYCHNANLIPLEKFNQKTYQDFFFHLEKRKSLLEGVCITGGEPLLRDDIFEFIQNIKALGYQIKLDTNGSFPKRLAYLLENKWIDYVAMDIKTAFRYYNEVIDMTSFDVDLVRESLAQLRQHRIPYELRTTFISPLHTIEKVKAMAEDIAGDDLYFLQNFQMTEGIRKKAYSGFPKEILESYLQEIRKHLPNSFLREV